MTIPRSAPWQPARFQSVDVVRLAWLLSVLSLVRGLDYAIGHDSKIANLGGTSSLVGIESAFGLKVWALLLIVPAVLLMVGMVTGRHHFLVWISHVALSAVFLGLTIGLVAGYVDRPYFDGIRSGAGLVLPTALHFLFWWRMGPRPLTYDIDGGA